MPNQPPTPSANMIPRGHRYFRLFAYFVLALALGCVLFEATHVLVLDNFHAVIPGRVYRSAQLSGAALERVIRAHGIRTVINLRGCCVNDLTRPKGDGCYYPFEWYVDECRATHAGGASLEDIWLSAGRMPGVHEVRRLVDILDRCEYPVLLHCRRGADRTGVASTVVQLLHTDNSLDDCCRQLSLRFGHLGIGRTEHLGRFLDLYKDWLRDEGRDHSPLSFRDWVATDTFPGECRCALELVDPPSYVPLNTPCAVTLRATNRGVKPWRLSPNINVGVHAQFVLYDEQEARVDLSRCVGMARGGLYDGSVPAGASEDWPLILPALSKPGRYRLLVDMVDGEHCWFHQMGSEPLEWCFEVR